MTERKEQLEELRLVIDGQLELLRLILHVISEGPTWYKGQLFKSSLANESARAVGAVSMGAGQSLGTILRNSNETGITVRDLYPIARAVVEGFINAAFFATQPVEVAERAFKHCHYAAWKHRNRIVGTGDFMFTLGEEADLKGTVARDFPEFHGKGNDSWSNLSAPSKIDQVGRVVRAAGGALMGAYAGIYAVSSEIIHGSVYGMSYFMSVHGRKAGSVDSFLVSTESPLVC